jgi:serpin B
MSGDLQFATRLYQPLRKGTGNLFFSPESVRIALAMAYGGARGDTAKQMHQVLALEPGRAAHEAIGVLLNSWDALAHPSTAKSSDPELQKHYDAMAEKRRITLRVVNRVWAQKKSLVPAYLGLLKDVYRAPLGELDFLKEPEPSRTAINDWVAKKTEQKIKDLIAHGMITKDTRLVLTSAVYWKAHWQEPFEAGLTKEGPFFLDPHRQVKAKLMHQTGRFRYRKFDGGEILELPYGEGEMVMDFVLPPTKHGVGELEEKLIAGGLPSWLTALKTARVEVTLPRFKMSSSFSLGPTLAGLGMERAFKLPGADFSGIDGTHELYIGAVVHQAYVDLDEQGTEAAAATAVEMLAGSAPPSEPPIPFKADHPFVFLLRDPKSGAVLFLGRLADPTSH